MRSDDHHGRFGGEYSFNESTPSGVMSIDSVSFYCTAVVYEYTLSLFT